MNSTVIVKSIAQPCTCSVHLQQNRFLKMNCNLPYWVRVASSWSYTKVKYITKCWTYLVRTSTQILALELIECYNWNIFQLILSYYIIFNTILRNKNSKEHIMHDKEGYKSLQFELCDHLNNKHVLLQIVYFVYAPVLIKWSFRAVNGTRVTSWH